MPKKHPRAVYDHPFTKSVDEHGKSMTYGEFSDYIAELRDKGGEVWGEKGYAFPNKVGKILEGKAIPNVDEVNLLAEVMHGSSTQGPGRKLVEQGIDFISH